jgi:hypothetical protein
MKTKVSASQRHWFRICGLAALLAFTTGALSAQSPAPRIVAEINASSLAQIPGSLHPLARPQNDAGRMAAGTPIDGITLYFLRSPAQQADLDALLVAQQDPSSPLFHQWLTPDQFAARFGMAQADQDKVQNWLLQQGFTIDSVNRSRNAIRFTGTVAQVESAFATEMHYYMAAGQKHFAPSTALSVPAAIAPVVAAIRNLDDFRPRSAHIPSRRAFTSGETGNVFFAPGDIHTTYDMSPLLSGGINGAGQTIAIMGQSYISVSDIENFESAAGMTKKDPTLVLVPGTGADQTTSPGDEGESDLDLEWSGAMAPGANLVFVYTGSNSNAGVFDSAQYAIDNSLGTIISISYTSCETELSQADATQLEAMFQQAAAQGQSVFSASGDEGSTACFEENPPQQGDLPLNEQEALAVNYPASSAYVTGVGGTEISSSDIYGGANFSTYWNSNYNSSNPTTSNDLTSSAKQYIPEIVWNDDAPNCGQANCLSSTGGGTSALIAQPSWQTSYFAATGEANPASQSRLVPDVAFYSSPGFPGYLYCTSDQSDWGSSQTGSCGSGFRASSSDASLTVAGGTSFATPIFAGMVALLNQKANYVTGAGLVNPTLYKLASNSATYAAAFHDVTSGNNNCLAGSANCSGTAGFSAGTGYDEVTGLGSVDLGALATVWPVNTGTSAALIGTTTTVSPANSAPNVNTNDVFTITVASDTGSTVPTGTVTLQIDGGANCFGEGASEGCGGTTVSNQKLSANGTVTYTANFATAGTHQVLAMYSGDATHAASTGVGEVSIAVVSSNKGTISASATPSTLTVAQGSSGNETITITPAGGYTGTVLVNIDFGSSGDNALQNLCGGFSPANTAGLGTVAITGAQAGSVILELDTNASDCANEAIAKAKGLHSLRQMHAGNLIAGSEGSHGKIPAPNPLSAAIALCGLVLAGLIGRHSRKLRNLICIAALAAAGLAMSACGGSSTTTVSNPPKGTYTGTISAADSNTSTISTTTTFTFVID